MFFYGCHGESGWEGVLRTGLWVLQSLWLSVCGSPMCCGLLSYYVRVVSLGATLTSFRASNSKARFSCLTTSHSPTVAVALVKNVYQTFFWLRAASRMTKRRVSWTRDDNFKVFFYGSFSCVLMLFIFCYSELLGIWWWCMWKTHRRRLFKNLILGIFY